jgi:hypothetical protein
MGYWVLVTMGSKQATLVRGRRHDGVGGLDAVTTMDATMTMTMTTTMNLNEM